MTKLDYTLVVGPLGVVLHVPSCPEVQKAREAGVPLMTMFDCKRDPDIALRCVCVGGER